MWASSQGIVLDKKTNLIQYTRFLKDVVNLTLEDGLKSIVIAGLDQHNAIKVTEHINLEWLIQVEEYDIFCWLQTTLRKKEAYKFLNENLILIISYWEWNELIAQKLEKLGEMHTI